MPALRRVIEGWGEREVEVEGVCELPVPSAGGGGGGATNLFSRGILPRVVSICEVLVVGEWVRDWPQTQQGWGFPRRPHSKNSPAVFSFRLRLGSPQLVLGAIFRLLLCLMESVFVGRYNHSETKSGAHETAVFFMAISDFWFCTYWWLNGEFWIIMFAMRIKHFFDWLEHSFFATSPTLKLRQVLANFAFQIYSFSPMCSTIRTQLCFINE